MFTKLEQCSRIKIEVTRGCSTQECFQGLHEACADGSVAISHSSTWVKELREDRDAVQDYPMWRTTEFNALLTCWMLIKDGLYVSLQRKPEYVTKLCYRVVNTEH